MSRLRVKLWVSHPAGEFGAGHIQIMHEIARTGSILAASKAMQMSYKKTWNKKTQIEEILSGNIFKSQPGRGKSAGTLLSDKAVQISQAFNQLEREVAAFADERFKEILLPLLNKDL